MTVGVLLFDGGSAIIPAATYILIVFESALAYIALIRPEQLDNR